MHRHFCEIAGHDWQCSDNCECICGLPMEGHDHSDCPVELRPCPNHPAEYEVRMLEAMSDDGALPELAFDEPQGTAPIANADVRTLKSARSSAGAFGAITCTRNGAL